MRAVARGAILLLASCATPDPNELDAHKKEPDVVVTLENKTAASHCGAQIEVRFGGVPDGATKLTAGILTSKRPRPQLRYEQIARAIAKQQCADGVSILGAEEVDGGFVYAEVALWLWPDG